MSAVDFTKGVIPNYAGLPEFQAASIIFFAPSLNQAEQFALLTKAGKLDFTEVQDGDTDLRTALSLFEGIGDDLTDLYKSPETAAKWLIAYLKANKLTTCVVGSTDRLTVNLVRNNGEGDLLAFLREFAQLSQGKHKIVLMGRYLPRKIALPFVETGDGMVLGDEFSLGGKLYAPEYWGIPHLEARLFGMGEILLNGMPVEEWSPLARHLIFYFIANPMLTRDEIFENFWPDMFKKKMVKDMTNVFHVTKRNADERLATAAGLVAFNLTDYKSEFYRPSGEFFLHCDLTEFQKLLEKAEHTVADAQRLAILEQATSLSIYPFLNADIENDGMAWITSLQHETMTQTMDALVEIGHLYLRQNDWKNAFRAFTRAIRTQPIREDVARELMRLSAKQQDFVATQAIYDLLKSTLQQQYKIDPAKDTITLLVELLGEENAQP